MEKKFFLTGLALVIATEATLYFIEYPWFVTTMAIVGLVVEALFFAGIVSAMYWATKKINVGKAMFVFPSWAPLFAPYGYTFFFNHGLAAWLEMVKGEASRFAEIIQLGWLQTIYSLDWLSVESLRWDWDYQVLPDSPFTLGGIIGFLGLAAAGFELYKAANLETAPIDTLLSVSAENIVIVVAAMFYPNFPPGPFTFLVGVSVLDVIVAPMLVVVAARHRLGGRSGLKQ